MSELEPVIAEDQTSAVNENGNNGILTGRVANSAHLAAYKIVTRLIADEISRKNK